MGPETGGAWREEREETRHHCHGAEVSRLAASSMGERRRVRALAEQQPGDDAGSSVIKNIEEKRKTKRKRRVPVTALNAWPNFHSQEWNGRSTIRWQHRLKREHPTCTRR